MFLCSQAESKSNLTSLCTDLQRTQQGHLWQIFTFQHNQVRSQMQRLFGFFFLERLLLDLLAISEVRGTYVAPPSIETDGKDIQNENGQWLGP